MQTDRMNRPTGGNLRYPSENQRISYVYGFQSDILLCLLIVMCTLGMGIQSSLETVFGIGFNRFVLELAILIAFLFLNINTNLLLTNNLYLLIFSFIAYGISFLLVPTKTLSDFFTEFLFNCMCGVVALTFVVNYDLLTKTLYYASIVNIALALLQITRLSGKISSYMSFGFQSFFAVSFFILYSFQKKDYLKVMIGIIISLILAIYSSRSCMVLLVALLIIMVYTLSMSVKLKISISLGITLFLANYKTTLLFLLNYLERFAMQSTYSLIKIRRMLEGGGVSSLSESEDRFEIFRVALEKIIQYPIGMGIGYFSSTGHIYPHNIFLDIWVTFGFFFGSCLMILVGKMILNTLSKKQNKNFYLVFIWLLINALRMMTSHSFVSDPTFFLLVAVCVNGAAYYADDGCQEWTDVKRGTGL